MKLRLLNIFVLLALLAGYIPSSGWAAEQLADNWQNTTIDSAKIQVLGSNAQGLILSLDTHTYNLETTTYAEGTYAQLTFPGGELWGEAGHPQLPVVSGLIGVPPGADVSLQISSVEEGGIPEPTLLTGRFLILPGPRPFPLENDFEPGRMGYEPDPTVYALDQWLPAEPVQLGEPAWIRDQRVMRVTFSPFQYNPAQRAIRWFPHLPAEITFSGGQSSQSVMASPFEDVFAQTLLNYETARFFRADFLDDRSQLAFQTYSSLGLRFDMAVVRDGIYHVSYFDLLAAGMDVENIDPTTFHLYNHGADVAMYVSGEDDGSFDPEDEIIFYGEKFQGDILAERYASMMDPGNGQSGNNWFWLCVPDRCDLEGAFEQYTDENIYSLTVGGTPGPRMSSVDGTPNGGAIPSVYTTTVRAEQSNLWWSYEFESEDVWFWSQVQRSTSTLPYTVTFPVELSSVAQGYAGTVHAEVVSFNSTPGYPDHHTQFRLNAGTPILDDAYWDGRSRHVFTAPVAFTSLLEGTNNLVFAMLPDVFPGTLRMFFDFFEVTYVRYFVAEDDELKFSREAPGTWNYELTGFDSATVEVYDITNPFMPVRVLNPDVSGSGPYDVSFTTMDGPSASYYVGGQTTFLTPVSITQYQPPDFATMPPADYIFITHEDFIPSLQPLVDYHQSNGLEVAVIDVDDLYREFNDGIYHPIAIKNFLVYSFAHWQTPPTYVTLVGSGHWNFKNLGGDTQPFKNPPPVYMPPNLAYIDPWQGQTDATNLLATVVGDDALPDLHIARLPVSSPAELDTVVSKTLAFETQPLEDWQRNITFIADNVPDSAGDFVLLAEGIITDFIEDDAYYEPVRIYENDFGCTTGNTPACDAVTNAIVDTLSITGTLIVNYIGHGALNRWSGESIFLNADVATLNNPDQLPIVLSMTCLDGYWIYPSSNPDLSSLSRMFLLASGKGAVATFSPSGLGVATGHDQLQRGFFDALYNQGHWELGSAAMQAKVKLFATNNNFDLMHTYTVFGDPALRFPTPYGIDLTPNSAQQEGQPGQTLTYTLDVTNTGLVTDTYTVTVSGNGWDTSLEDSIVGPLAPGESVSISAVVVIPPDALGNETDTAIVVATSHSATNQTDSATLTTTALTDGLVLTPASQSDLGPPGATITYTFALTNTSNTTDTFTLSILENEWTANLSTPSLLLGTAQSQEFQLIVQIPPSALGNEFDQISVIAQSTNDPAHAALATTATTAITDNFSLMPTELSQIGLAGSTVTYVLQVRNFLNSLEYYSVSLSGNAWETTAPVTVGPVNPGETINFLVKVTVPITATTGLTDTVAVTVSILNMPESQATSELTTVAEALPPATNTIFLPVITKP